MVEGDWCVWVQTRKTGLIRYQSPAPGIAGEDGDQRQSTRQAVRGAPRPSDTDKEQTMAKGKNNGRGRGRDKKGPNTGEKEKLAKAAAAAKKAEEAEDAEEASDA